MVIHRLSAPGLRIERLERHSAKLRKEAEDKQDDRDQNAYRIERLKRDADFADSLAQFMSGLFVNLSHGNELSTWKTWCAWIKELIDGYLGKEESRQTWPAIEQEAANQIETILKRLANLDEIDRHPRPSTFRHTLASELGAPTGRIGGVGRGVLSGRIGDSLGMELDRAILIGLAEGVFPHRPYDDPLLPDRERELAGDDLTLLSNRMGDQHRHLLSALASAPTSIMIFARGDSRRASEQHPSRWLLDTATALAGRVVDSTNLEDLAYEEWFEHVPSFSGRVLHANFPATNQEFQLQALARADRFDDLPLDGDQVLSRGVEMVRARTSEQFTRFDGNLAAEDTSGLSKEVVSPTSLETWADCPMRYFFRHVLRVLPVDQPEELLEISPLVKGSLVHDALDEFMRKQLDEGRVPSPGTPWSDTQRDQLQAIGLKLCQEAEDQGLTGTPVYWHHNRRRILSDLDRFLEEDDKQRQDNSTTLAASELAFGMPDSELGPVVVKLPDGQEVHFRGRADRVERDEANGLMVTDYKTGNATSYRKLEKGRQGDDWDPVLRGTKLQLPVYGLAARSHVDNPDAPVRTQYWFITSDQQFKAFGYDLDDEVMDRFCSAVGTITKGMENGVFCDRPDPNQTDGRFSQRCEYCNSDRLGTQDQRRAWERKQDRDELSEFRILAEPAAEEPVSRSIDNGPH